MNTDEQQTFKNGDKLVKAEEAVYLEDTLNYKTNATAEIDRRIQQINITLMETGCVLESYRGKQEMAATNL